MNHNSLTLLGCSGSLLVVLMGSPARAILPPGAMDNGIKNDTLTVSQPIAQEEAPQVSTSVASDRIKQLAANVFGCTCANCMNAVRQMIQQGTLSL